MDISDRYKWEAETSEGKIVSSGGSLAGCVRFSLIPRAAGLPRVDIAGVPLRRRFCRSFAKVALNRKKDLPGLVFWENGQAWQKTSEDLTGELARGDIIGKGVDGDGWYAVAAVVSDAVILMKPYEGKSKPRGFRAKKLVGVGIPHRQYFHCIETDSARLWVDYITGRVLVTPRSYEHYI